VSLRRILPKEHGTWAMLLVPWAIGCGIARRLAWQDLLLLVAMLLFFRNGQAFPGFYVRDPVFRFVLAGVKDAFMINYGSGGIGSEIIANRLGVGPMHDCLTCAYEEFFLTSFTVGDPAQLTDVAQELNLPPVKIHCSVLAEDAIKAAIADWQKKRGAASAALAADGERKEPAKRNGLLKAGI